MTIYLDMKLTTIISQQISIVQELAREIWNEHYIKILSQPQIDYMLDLFYSDERILSEIKEGVVWEMLMDNETPIGYLVCKIESDKLYISKIYLKAEPAAKVLGNYFWIMQSNWRDKIKKNPFI